MDFPVDILALVSQHVMNACKDNYGTAVLAVAPSHSCNKMEYLVIKVSGQLMHSNALQRRLAFSFTAIVLAYNNFLLPTVMKFH